MDIHSRTQQIMDAACAGILPQHRSESLDQFGIPRGREPDTAHRGGWTVIAYAHRTVGHFLLGQTRIFVPPNIETARAAEQVNLLLEVQATQDGIDPMVDVRLGKLVSGL